MTINNSSEATKIASEATKIPSEAGQKKPRTIRCEASRRRETRIYSAVMMAPIRRASSATNDSVDSCPIIVEVLVSHQYEKV